MSNTYKPTSEEISRVKGLGFLIDKTTGCHFNARVLTVNGRIDAKKMMHIAAAAEKFGNGYVAMTTRQTIEIQHIPFENIQPLIEFLGKEDLEVGGTGPKVRPIVSCKGTTCRFGLIDTFSLSEKIHYTFYKGYHNVKLPHKFKIAVGGCPNNCVKPDLNDLGIIGCRKPAIEKDKCRGCKTCAVEKACPINAAYLEKERIMLDGCNGCARCEGKCPFGAVSTYETGYKIYIGGRWGKKTACGKSLNTVFKTEDEVLRLVESAILFFKEYGVDGERFADTIARLGFEETESILVSGNLISRKEEIISK